MTEIDEILSWASFLSDCCTLLSRTCL